MAYKVFQFASGGVGAHAARAVLRRSTLQLVGLHVTSLQKAGELVSEIVGIDAGELRATQDIQAIIDSDADVVLHAPLAAQVYAENPGQDLDDICTLLAGGKNVITVVGYMYPRVHGREVVERLTDACLKGGSSFHGTGLNPGWMGELLPLTMSALSRNIERIHILEISNFQYYPSPEIMFESMGFGAPPDVFHEQNQRRTQWLNGLFSESIAMLADGVGLGLDDITSTLEISLAEHTVKAAAGDVAKGSVAGQHWTWAGVSEGKEKIVHETVWRMHADVAPEWPTGKHQIMIDGHPKMRLQLDADYVSDGLLATAMHAVNAIPSICAAPPGIHTFLDLPWLTGFGAFDDA